MNDINDIMNDINDIMNDIERVPILWTINSFA